MIIFILIIMFLSIIVFTTKDRERLAQLMTGILLSNIVVIIGGMFYYAKMGGLSEREQIVFFLHDYIQKKLLHATISLDMISRFIVLGRSLFLFFILIFALEIYLGNLSKIKSTWYLLISILPIFNTIIYDPVVFRRVLSGNIDLQKYLSLFTRLWGYIYILLTLSLIWKKYNSISIQWIKKKLRYILATVINLIILFVVFSLAGPMQVSDPSGIDYVNYYGISPHGGRFSSFQWIFILLTSMFVIIMGLKALWGYTLLDEREGKFDISLERKIKTANMGARIFTHGIKNQLLAMSIVLRNMETSINNRKSSPEELNEYINDMRELNEQILNRMNALYSIAKSNSVFLTPTKLGKVMEHVKEKIYKNKDKILFNIQSCNSLDILADKTYLSEAIYNVISNAIDATEAKGSSKEIEINCLIEGKWCILEIVDYGIGIERSMLNNIFDPFFTKKSTNTNWGLGLSFTQQIIKAHYGHVKVESEVGVGTKFYISIPLYY